MEDPFKTIQSQERLPEYLYTDNHESSDGAIMFRCNASSIAEADKLFQERFGYDPKGESSIGCVTESDVNEKWTEKHSAEN